MKNIIIIALIVVVIYLGYKFGTKSLDNLSYDVKFASGFKEVLNGITGNIGSINVDFAIGNKNTFDIPVNGLYAEIYYQGNLIAKSTQPQGKFIIPKNGQIKVPHNVTVVLGDSTFDAVGKVISGKSVDFTYKIRGTAWIIPFGYKSTFTT